MKARLLTLLISHCFLLFPPQIHCSEGARKGEKIFRQQGCTACHGDQTIQGPRLQNLYGSLVKLKSGRVIKVDEKYLRESILDPQKKIVRGFKGIMPSYRGILSEEDLNDLVEYLKQLKTTN